MIYNTCKTCGAHDGRCGVTIDGECWNCHHTRKNGNVSISTALQRTEEEIERTIDILDAPPLPTPASEERATPEITKDTESIMNTETGQNYGTNKPITPLPKSIPYAFVFDAESIGLHGETFAIGYVVIGPEGFFVEQGFFALDPKEEPRIMGEESEDYKWVMANIPPIPVTHQFKDSMICAFWETWMRWKEKGALMFADVTWPVEARWLNACIDWDEPSRKWEGPYPLLDIASIRLAAGFYPLNTEERLDGEFPAHNPLCDARQSARLLLEALKKLGEVERALYLVSKHCPAMDPFTNLVPTVRWLIERWELSVKGWTQEKSTMRYRTLERQRDILLERVAALEASHSAKLPKEPSPGLLMSMALRYDHALGCDGYYDSPESGITHAQRLKSTLSTMRQIYEEVAGTGFYAPDKESSYAVMIPIDSATKGER